MTTRKTIQLSVNRDSSIAAVLNEVQQQAKTCNVVSDYQKPPYGTDIWIEFDDAACTDANEAAPAGGNG